LSPISASSNQKQKNMIIPYTYTIRKNYSQRYTLESRWKQTIEDTKAIIS
jgi:hypothetical protein